jgi:hypothetical protein
VNKQNNLLGSTGGISQSHNILNKKPKKTSAKVPNCQLINDLPGFTGGISQSHKISKKQNPKKTSAKVPSCQGVTISHDNVQEGFGDTQGSIPLIRGPQKDRAGSAAPALPLSETGSESSVSLGASVPLSKKRTLSPPPSPQVNKDSTGRVQPEDSNQKKKQKKTREIRGNVQEGFRDTQGSIPLIRGPQTDLAASAAPALHPSPRLGEAGLIRHISLGALAQGRRASQSGVSTPRHGRASTEFT